MKSLPASHHSLILGLPRFAALLLPALFVLSACGGSSGGMSTSPPAKTPAPPPTSTTTDYELTYLVSNSSAIPAQSTDPKLINAWGLAFNPQAYAWVSDAGSNYSSLYDGNGSPPASGSGVPAYITIPAGSSGTGEPTGITYNATSGFDISSGGVSAPATFIFATLGGSIDGWNETVNANSAVVAYNSTNGAMFTAVTMATESGTTYLYAADFKNGTIDVFNSSFAPITVGGDFFDSAIPSGYAPYNIQNIPNSSGMPQLYVTYAEPSSSPQHVTIGNGLGYVAVFQWDGTLISTLVSGGALNAPWGLAIAPSNFGSLSGALLVGNFGNGAIDAYNPTTGASMGTMMGANGQQLFVPGLWGLAFGNGYDSQPTTTLFFTGGPDTQTAGVFGRIDLPGAYTPPSGNSGSGSGGYG